MCMCVLGGGACVFVHLFVWGGGRVCMSDGV